MKEFYKWWEDYTPDAPGFVPTNKFIAADAFQAGMLAAADIAELAKEFILPADDLADLIAKQIREYADDD